MLPSDSEVREGGEGGREGREGGRGGSRVTYMDHGLKFKLSFSSTDHMTCRMTHWSSPRGSVH